MAVSGAIDLSEARALAARARENTSNGLTAREALPDVVDQLAAELRDARSLRLARPGDAVDPAVHTPERVQARLERLGWAREGGGRVAEIWHRLDDFNSKVLVALIPTAPDYTKVTGALAADLAGLYGVGELQVLKGIAEASDAQA